MSCSISSEFLQGTRGRLHLGHTSVSQHKRQTAALSYIGSREDLQVIERTVRPDFLESQIMDQVQASTCLRSQDVAGNFKDTDSHQRSHGL